MNVPALFIARASDGSVGTSLRLPTLWQVQNQCSSARRLGQSYCRSLPTGVAAFIAIKHRGDAVVRNHQDVRGPRARLSRRVSLAQQMNRKGAAVTEVTGEHAQNGFLIADETIGGSELILSAPQGCLHARSRAQRRETQDRTCPRRIR